MANDGYKKYTQEARRGIKGEAFFESLVVDHVIPHRIARQNDLGIDFLCEWVHGDRPTGILFAAQVKTRGSGRVTAKLVEQASRLNLLDLYTLTGADVVDPGTIEYWKGLGLPAFLFYVLESESDDQLKCFAKRCTPLLDGRSGPEYETGSQPFYLVNRGAKFLAFGDDSLETGGFARDLIVDFVRLWYSKGFIFPLTPGQLGFWPFPDKGEPDAVHCFGEILRWHQDKVTETCERTRALLSQIWDER